MKKITIFCAVFIAVISAVRIAYINTNAEEYKIYEQTYDKSENVVWNDYEIAVKSFEIISAEDMEERYGYKNNSDEEIYYAIVNIDYEYIGTEKEKGFDVASMYLMSGTWENGAELFATMSINSEKIEHVVFFLDRRMFSGKSWKKLQDRHYQLAFNNYPCIKVVDL
jgi:parvulin-like peptidyl-prolyl isomerase